MPAPDADRERFSARNDDILDQRGEFAAPGGISVAAEWNQRCAVTSVYRQRRIETCHRACRNLHRTVTRRCPLVPDVLHQITRQRGCAGGRIEGVVTVGGTAGIEIDGFCGDLQCPVTVVVDRSSQDGAALLRTFTSGYCSHAELKLFADPRYRSTDPAGGTSVESVDEGSVQIDLPVVYRKWRTPTGADAARSRRALQIDGWNRSRQLDDEIPATDGSGAPTPDPDQDLLAGSNGHFGDMRGEEGTASGIAVTSDQLQIRTGSAVDGEIAVKIGTVTGADREQTGSIRCESPPQVSVQLPQQGPAAEGIIGRNGRIGGRGDVESGGADEGDGGSGAIVIDRLRQGSRGPQQTDDHPVSKPHRTPPLLNLDHPVSRGVHAICRLLLLDWTAGLTEENLSRLKGCR